MVRSVINGEIIKGEIFTRFDIEKIIIQFRHVSKVNFIIKKGSPITLDLMIGDKTIPIIKDGKIDDLRKEVDKDIFSELSIIPTVVTLFINYPE